MFLSRIERKQKIRIRTAATFYVVSSTRLSFIHLFQTPLLHHYLQSSMAMLCRLKLLKTTFSRTSFSVVSSTRLSFFCPCTAVVTLYLLFCIVAIVFMVVLMIVGSDFQMIMVMLRVCCCWCCCFLVNINFTLFFFLQYFFLKNYTFLC
jgi:hypothetical protein